MSNPVLFRADVVEFSKTHKRWYTNAGTEYRADGRRHEYLTRAMTCAECGDWIFDGDSICGPQYDAEYWRVVHVNCCKEHDHGSESDDR